MYYSKISIVCGPNKIAIHEAEDEIIFYIGEYINKAPDNSTQYEINKNNSKFSIKEVLPEPQEE